MSLPKILPQENAFLREVLLIMAESYVTGNRIFYVCLLPEMTAIQVTVDKNILFILQSFSLNMLYIYVTLNNFTKVKKCIIRF